MMSIKVFFFYLCVILSIIWHVLKLAFFYFVIFFIPVLLWHAVSGIKDENGNINWPLIIFLALRVLLVCIFVAFLKADYENIDWWIPFKLP
jgi:hypothetical protein